MKKVCYGLCLLISIVVNILFSVNWYVGGGGGEKKWISSTTELSWSKKAAAQAEAVAAVSCSGHGRAYIDGLSSEGQPICQCDGCYFGDDCSEFNDGCPADAQGGDTMFLEPFWKEHRVNSAVLTSGWHRMSYSYTDRTTMSSELEKYIRKLHSLVGNTITEGRYMVFGVGSAQLINAAVYALSSQNASSPSTFVALIPFYPLFKTQIDLLNSKNFEYGGDTRDWISRNSTKIMDVVEVVTSPNNPGGELEESLLGGKAIYDQVYYWPHFTPIPTPSDQDFMIYSLSKLTGHAGTRFGWAVIKDEAVYNKVMEYIQTMNLGISKDTQLRALNILKVIVEGDNVKPFFKYAHDTMSDRWKRITFAFSKSTRFSIQQRRPSYDSFVNKTREPFPAFVWVKCERPQDVDCRKVLIQEGNIIGRAGSFFLAKDRYVRLSLTKTQDDFELLLQRVTELVSHENGDVESM